MFLVYTYNFLLLGINEDINHYIYDRNIYLQLIMMHKK